MDRVPSTATGNWDELPLPFQSLDVEGTILAVNSPWCDYTGYSADEVVGTRYIDLVPEESRDQFLTNLETIRRDGRLDAAECRLRHRSGEIVDFSVYGRLWGQGEDAVTHCLLVDVTAHRRTAMALLESEERYRRLFELAPNPVVVHDGRCIEMANSAAAVFLGFEDADQLLGRSVSEFVHADDAAVVRDRVTRMMTEEWVAPLNEERFVRRDGGIAVGQTIAAPVTVNGRRMVHVAAIDVGDRLVTESALEESEERFRLIFERSVEPKVVHDGVRVVLVNEAACAFFRISESDSLGAPIMRFIHPDDQLEVTRRAQAIFAGTPSPAPFEVRVVRTDGTVVHTEVRSSAIPLHGALVMTTTFRDLTDRKAAESELERYRDQLETLLAERTARLNRAQAELDAITAAMARTVELRDPYTAGHQRRVAELSVAMAREMGMDDEQQQAIHIAAAMHDIGKISIPAEILSKPGRFSPIEFELVKGHCQAGYEILASAEVADDVATMVHQHHERFDGSGYPLGLSGEQLLPGACVLMVADVVEAISSHRPYRPAIGIEAALAEISENRGVRYCEAAVDSCLAVFGRGFEFSATD